MEILKQASGEIVLTCAHAMRTGKPPNFFIYNPLLCSFSLQFMFFSEQPFYGNYSTLDSHTFACS